MKNSKNKEEIVKKDGKGENIETMDNDNVKKTGKNSQQNTSNKQGKNNKVENLVVLIKKKKKKNYNFKTCFEGIGKLDSSEQLNLFFKIFLNTIFRIVGDFIIMFIAICIFINLLFRVDIPSYALFPSNPNKAPWVFFSKNPSEEQLITTDNPNISLSTDTDFKKLKLKKDETGRISENNIDTINNLLLKADKQKLNEVQQSYIKTPTANSIPWYVKFFSNTHKDVTSDELSIPALLSFIILDTYISINSTLSSISDKLKVRQHFIMFILFSFFVYSFYKSEKNTISDILYHMFYDKKKPNINKDFGAWITSKLLTLLSSLIAPFIFISKVLFIFLVPLVMLLFAFSCYKYTNYTNVIIIKTLAFIASGISMFSFLGYLTSIGYIISNISNSKKNTTKNANSFFDDILNEMFNVVKMLSNMGKNLVGIGKKSKKNKKCKEPSMMGGGIFSLFYSFIILFFMPFIIIPFMISTSATLNLSLKYTYGFLNQLMNIIKKINK